MKKLLVLILVFVSLNSHAWGEREQGALLGLVIGSVITHRQVHPEPRIYYQQNSPQPTEYAAPYGYRQRTLVCGVDVICYPVPLICNIIPVYTGTGEFVGYQKVCR